jgi:hypothetical protein
MCVPNVGLRTFENVAKEIPKDFDSGLVQWERGDDMQLGWRMGIFGT